MVSQVRLKLTTIALEERCSIHWATETEWMLKSHPRLPIRLIREFCNLNYSHVPRLDANLFYRPCGQGEIRTPEGRSHLIYSQAVLTTYLPTQTIKLSIWWDSDPHIFRYKFLKLTCLPIPPQIVILKRKTVESNHIRIHERNKLAVCPHHHQG